jgi:hypothetical protein
MLLGSSGSFFPQRGGPADDPNFYINDDYRGVGTDSEDAQPAHGANAPPPATPPPTDTILSDDDSGNTTMDSFTSASDSRAQYVASNAPLGSQRTAGLPLVACRRTDSEPSSARTHLQEQRRGRSVRRGGCQRPRATCDGAETPGALAAARRYCQPPPQ